ncbi:DUF4342 domain-containing protein [Roseiflexus castenholzii]|jgi:hypothetical protein|uniref:DUF4342 domain-containing protein n=1 Tax=Roseiflexus castenholzii (strain DSM 13941 / HLO8) TaxID=383372 RepID=A7NPZ8_ROSCS|nr:DUF4342 domain-containing protein [Roseiflexus castenholzii]ABU59644.1 conserved hypothetical protein [Roseiflexus castenholzii DSM 13941]
MTVQSATETITVDGGTVVEQLRECIAGGNVQRIVIRQGFQPVASFSTIGGMLSAAVQSAINTLASALGHCTIEIERITPESYTRDPDLDTAGIHWIGVAPIPEGAH